ncbi:glycosyl transferase, group 1 family protein [Synechococcus sp. PCC 7335]|uniref:glycosyltransferase n=1 Tax=Synechococcus sp. (strain ATCC 29403 / PCC 7335) TaxID=91464 RepID=UPI00017EB06A|nr:glycosyltransferase [Synechococcus sp. PCC 7335]EDX86263.1 glycosyl transferase, group 1 family protein [Synechococcus sp. PCC 7335]
MKIALVHDYLNQRGGAERVFEMFCNHFPDADVYTSVYDPKSTIELRNRLVKTTFLQNVPGAKRYFRLFAPLYFPAFRALDLEAYDLIISSSSSFAKAVKKRPDARHICFCHNVSRFLWDTKTYLGGYQEFEAFEPFLKLVFSYMKRQDITYAGEPDIYVANSTTVAKRIRSIYRKKVLTINYPINDDCFTFSDQKEDFYLVSSRLLSYKRVDVIVEAFNQLGWPLRIIGIGPEQQRLEAKAASNIQFLGHVSDDTRRQLFSTAKSVIVAALEDYGLVPVEANFSGTPVIAFGAGGALDTQVSGKTGILFQEQTAASLCSALIEAQSVKWDYAAIQRHAKEKFTREAFFRKVDRMITNLDTFLAEAETGQINTSAESYASMGY